MEITHIGHSCFKLRGKAVTLVTDPFDPEMVGIKYANLAADVVTVSHGHRDHNYVEGVKDGHPLIIAGPGEYEVKGVRVIGAASFHDNLQGSERGQNTIYRIQMDGISLVHCGDLGHLLSDEDLEFLEDVDIVFIPAGGIYTISAKEAAMLVSKIEPQIIIPMHYRTDKLNQNNFGTLSDVSLFLKELGKEGITPVPKLNITKDKIPVEPTVVVLE